MCMPYCMPRYATFLICTSRAATRYELSTRYPHFRVASLSFFLLQTSSFTSQSLCSTHLQTRLLTNGYGRPLPRGPTRSITDRDEGDDAWRGQDTTTLTCPCLVVSLHLHTRRRRAPRGCPHGITMSLAFARAPSPHSFRRFTLFFVSFFFLFSASSCCGPVAALLPPSLPTDALLSSPSGPTTAQPLTVTAMTRGCGTTRRDDSYHNRSTTQRDDRDRDTARQQRPWRCTRHGDHDHDTTKPDDSVRDTTRDTTSVIATTATATKIRAAR